MIAIASLVLAQAGVAAVPATWSAEAYQYDQIEARVQSTQAQVTPTPEGGWQCTLSATTGVAYVDDRLCQITARCLMRNGATYGEGYDRCFTRAQGRLVSQYARSITRGG